MLFAALVLAAAVSAGSGAPAPADGTYDYSIERGTDKIGNSTVTIKRSDSGITAHETETMPGSSFVVDEIFDSATLAPKSYVATYTLQGTSQTVRVTFDRSGATARFDGINTTSTLPLPTGVRNAFVVELALMSGFMLLPAQVHQARVADFSEIIPSKMAQVPNRVDQTVSPTRPAGVPNGDVSLSISGLVSYDEWYDPATFVLHAVSVPVQNVVMRLTKQTVEATK